MKKFCRFLVFILPVALVVGCQAARPELEIAPPELPPGRVGEAYTATITASGNQTPVFLITVDKQKLPLGLTLYYEKNERFAEIRGVPAKAGTYAFTVSAYCYGTNQSGQGGERRYQMRVRPKQ